MLLTEPGISPTDGCCGTGDCSSGIVFGRFAGGGMQAVKAARIRHSQQSTYCIFTGFNI